MPLIRGHDLKSPFIKWGKHGKKYRYKAKNRSSLMKAKRKAIRQAIAIAYNRN